MQAQLNKTRSPLILLRREHKDLLEQIAPESPKKVIYCAGFIISYLQHWSEWKATRYKILWVYQSLKDIQADLMQFSMHVIRAALELLEKLGLLSIRKNNRTRTNEYFLHSDRIEHALENCFSPSKAKTPETFSPVESEGHVPSSESHHFTVETHTQITSLIPLTDSSLLIKEKERENFVQEEIEDFWAVEDNDDDEVKQKVVASFDNTQDVSQQPEDSGEDHFSAAPEPKCSEVIQPELKPLPKSECSKAVQVGFKPLPKLKSDRISGFRSDAERDGFYQALLELGKSQGKTSPVAWAAAIIKSINAGDPCQYLIEYRDGQPVGISEKQEWEDAPGRVFPQFTSFLKTRLKKAEMTDEQAIEAAHRQLKDVNLARSLWESCKRSIANYQDNWEKQKRLGVENAYLPPELIPEQKVSVEQAGSAIASLQSGTIQLQVLPESAARAELEPAKEVSTDPEPEPPSPAELQQKLNSPLQAPLARMMARNAGYRVEDDLVLPAEGMPSVEYLRSLLNTENRALTAKKIQRLIEGNPQWGFYFDDFGELWGF